MVCLVGTSTVGIYVMYVFSFMDKRPVGFVRGIRNNTRFLHASVCYEDSYEEYHSVILVLLVRLLSYPSLPISYLTSNAQRRPHQPMIIARKFMDF